MDFSSLLGLAQEKQSNKIDIKRYSTKVSGAKKVSPKEKKLSENVRRFMEKREEEDRQKKAEAAQRTRALMAKRSEDKKSMKTMKSMLQRTKSANKAVVPLESNQTADSIAGRNQCDEDDYGYESGTAHNFYDKLMKKYEATKIDPDERINRIMKTPKEIRSTLSRVKSALDEDTPGEENTAHVRKKRARKGSSPSREPSPNQSLLPSAVSHKTRKERELEARKIRLKNASKMPPTASFNDLIKMAEAKASGQPVAEPSAKPKSGTHKDFEFHRPMTNKMKEEFKREYMSRMRKAGKLPMSSTNSSSANCLPSTTSGKKEPPKKSSSEVATKAVPKAPPSEPPKKNPPAPPKNLPREPLPPKRDINSVKPREFPGEKKVSRPSQEPTSSLSHHHAKSQPSKKPFPQKRNRIESDDSEEDYDSEMDDFIDDTDANMDISAQIRGIFGYDRRKYRDEEDFDDRSMVANYSTIMKEEIRSAKIGKMEDLEDIKREEEELARKMSKKKRR